jgi:hypothetical protein
MSGRNQMKMPSPNEDRLDRHPPPTSTCLFSLSVSSEAWGTILGKILGEGPIPFVLWERSERIDITYLLTEAFWEVSGLLSAYRSKCLQAVLGWKKILPSHFTLGRWLQLSIPVTLMEQGPFHLGCSWSAGVPSRTWSTLALLAHSLFFLFCWGL